MLLKVYLNEFRRYEPNIADIEYRAMLREACRHFGVDGVLHLSMNISSKSSEGSYFHLLNSGTNSYCCTTSKRANFEMFDQFENQLLAQRIFSSDLKGKLLRFEPSIKFATNSSAGEPMESSIFIFAANLADAVIGDIQKRTYREFQLVGHILHQHVSTIYHSHDTKNTSSKLTIREIEVLQMSGHGKTYRDISTELKISSRTVRFFLESARHKLGCLNTTHAVATALQEGSISYFKADSGVATFLR